MAKESAQHIIGRRRCPRVQITYDVDVGDAQQQIEIPFGVCVFGDFSGNPDNALPQLKDRDFFEIDRDNFNEVLAGMKPRLAFNVDNKLTDDDSKIGVELRFNSLNDFHPERVAAQIIPVRKLIETRKKLSDLLRKLDGNDKLEELLQEMINNTESLDKLGKEAGVQSASADKQE